VPAEELSRIKLAKKKKDRERKELDLAARKQLANVRVIQKNLVYVLGLPNRLASEDVRFDSSNSETQNHSFDHQILKTNEYFGQYGKILKIVINRKPPPGSNPNSHSHVGVYITYARKEDAAKAIEAVDGSVCDNRMVRYQSFSRVSGLKDHKYNNLNRSINRATFGTTKYCSFFLKGQQCLNSGCQFLHEPGEEADSFTKDELIPQSKVTPKPPPFPTGDEKEDLLQPNAAGSWANKSTLKQASPEELQDVATAFPDALPKAKGPTALPSTTPPTTSTKKQSSSSSSSAATTTTAGPSIAAVMAAKTSPLGTPQLNFTEPEAPPRLPPVKPLEYRTPVLDPVIVNLALNSLQPKYSGPFSPFRSDVLSSMTPPKPIGNMKSPNASGPSNGTLFLYINTG
jgi:hypothetical protein